MQEVVNKLEANGLYWTLGYSDTGHKMAIWRSVFNKEGQKIGNQLWSDRFNSDIEYFVNHFAPLVLTDLDRPIKLEVIHV